MHCLCSTEQRVVKNAHHERETFLADLVKLTIYQRKKGMIHTERIRQKLREKIAKIMKTVPPTLHRKSLTKFLR
jgi:hypothetical protein